MITAKILQTFFSIEGDYYKKALLFVLLYNLPTHYLRSTLFVLFSNMNLNTSYSVELRIPINYIYISMYYEIDSLSSLLTHGYQAPTDDPELIPSSAPPTSIKELFKFFM